MRSNCRCISCITPPHLLKKLLESKDKEIRQAALNTLLTTERLRGERSVRSLLGATVAPTNGRRTIFDCRSGVFLPSASVAQTEDGAVSTDPSVNRAFDGFGVTRDFYSQIFNRNSIDDLGMRLDGYVHRGVSYNNAFWDGQEMVFGDGDQVVFTDFTASLDVIAHELTHGVTEHAAGLEYHNQSGALNESISDVFGSLVKQWSLQQAADEADWLIGAEVFTPNIEADALRSMKAPGTAYQNELLGRDPQPDHMDRFARLPDTDDGDYGGVHINSGIPNKAFYLTSIGIGGFAWEAPGHIWYESLKASSASTEFQAFADTTYVKAGQLYGTGSNEQQAVLDAWREVGIRITGIAVTSGSFRTRGGPADRGRSSREADSLAAFTKQIEALSTQVKAIAKDVSALKAKG
jgi:Zn-dependent metalloprotease